MTDSVVAQVCQIAAETFEAADADVRLESSPQTLANWDSIQHLNFILALEARFHVDLSAEEMEGIHSIADAVKIIEARTVI